ncbi:ABC transporter substrate-binding protein [Endozoicomonas sp. SM1973]|uniref:ABC transporter substrate-binding protein n=1 Tax=Spartinivicinus marinus TaxID=2994442 RepID=A0A853IAS4_9GAMM|nr:ABC transporter substrate-binding protein [Spartinivicinus marinus]MCX4025349.1 ABC transporter substrate-binding protein [Spartinivicinus marinus]NYZ68922.1 ABC transporter substrate-binding protein [Spartinivicinus marinus]
MRKIGWLGLFLLTTLFFNYSSAREKITLSTLNWEPYIGQELENKGYVNEIVKAAFSEVRYDLEVLFFPWARALHVATLGHVDGLFPEYYDENRLTDFVFSDPFPGGPVGFYKRKDKNIKFNVDPRKNLAEALKELRSYRFGVVRGYINTKEFDEADYLTKEEVINDDTNIKRLYKNRVQLIFIDKYVAQYIIAKRYPWYALELEFLEPPLEVKPLYIAFSKKAPDYQKKLALFNRGLKKIQENKLMEEIMMKHGF